jgi:hypothetical protein
MQYLRIYLYLTICHYVSYRLKEIADASMQAAESLTPLQAAIKIMGGMAEWRNGGMAEWREQWYGRKNGRMVEWREWLHTYYLRYTHTNDDDDDDNNNNTLIFNSIDDIWECIECYLNLPDTPHLGENPLNYSHIHELQQQDKQLLALQVKYPDNYVNLQLDDNVDDINCYMKDPTQPNWKIALPESMVVDTIKWFHQVMGHPGGKRLRERLNQGYHHPKHRSHIDKLSAKIAKNIN